MTAADTPTTISVPDLALIVLVGASGSGKSTFAARHFLPSEVVSSDACRLLVADDENDQGATEDAFDVLHHIAGVRLRAGRLTVVDATSVQRDARASLVQLARDHHVLPVAVVLDVPEAVCAARNEARPDRDLPARALRRQNTLLRKSLRHLQKEGFRRVFVLDEEAIATATVVRERRWTDRRDEHGPFDVIGDVHGCLDELVALLGTLGYEVAPDRTTAVHPDGRRAVFVGDLVDRGPDSPGVLRLAMGMVGAGTALCVPGNHENKLLRALLGRKVTVSHGLAETLAQLEQEDDAFRQEVAAFIDGLVSHAVLDGGALVVAHAGLPEALHNRSSGAVRAFALYGDTTGETDEFGLPVRYPWADDYRGRAAVVYGHTPTTRAEWINGTICLDTGCVFGGELTALRWPERELVAVPAARTHYEPIRPLAPLGGAPPGGPERAPEELAIDDVAGKRRVDTRLIPRITIEAERAAAALEVMSRFAADPRWLVHLPPTMAPVATSARVGLLEHPDEAFATFRSDGVAEVVCQEKHMGSRAVAVVCRSAAVAVERFRIDDPAGGIVLTRTGRPFFADPAWGTEVVARLRAAVDAAGLWDEWDSDWVVLDAELLPWSAKAGDLLRGQYAAVGAAARSTTAAATEVLARATARGVEVNALAARADERRRSVDDFVTAYRRYCWPVGSVDDLRMAPFAVLATEGRVRAGDDHLEQMAAAERLAAAAPGLVVPTRHRLVDLGDEASEAAATTWWSDLVEAGGEGMVVKPRAGVVEGRRGLVPLGLKVRGPEYLRIVYGPEYLAPENLARLRQRSIGRKSSLARREGALGLEALERFVAGEPLHRVHECVFAVLALESEPVDPRL